MKTRDLALCGLFAALIAILAQIAIPLPAGVPFTMQVLAVVTTGIVLGAQRGFIAVLIYVLLGAIGMPVFTNFTGGISILAGPTGGFILTFPFMALIVGIFAKKSNKLPIVLIGTILGAIINYIGGIVQFMLITKSDFIYSFSVCIAPFIIFDIAKWILAIIIGVRIKNHKSLITILKV